MLSGKMALETVKIMTPELEKGILEFKTRQCDTVLKGLYGNRFNNKELAKHIGISVSALSNVLQKIKTSHLDLLVVEQRGRNIYYSLSELGNEYVEKYLLDTFNIINLESAKISKDAKNALLMIKEIQNQANETWQWKIDEFLVNNISESSGNKIENSCFQLIQSIESVIMGERWEELNEIYKMLDSDILCQRIEKKFSKLMGIKSLCMLEDQDWEMTYRLVDDFFEQGGKFIRTEFLKQFQLYQINYDDIYKIYDVLEQLTTEAENKEMLKDAFYKEWKSFFAPHEKLLYYIAEKYS